MRVKETFGFSEDYSVWKHGNPKHMLRLQNGHPNGLKTKVTIKNHDTGEILFEGQNKTMIAGSEFMALHMFELPHDKMITPTYNNALNLDNTVNSIDPENTYAVHLFCIGTSGCNRESALKYEVDNKHWIYPTDDIIPIRYVPFTDDLTPEERNMYFGRYTDRTRNYYAYYFKKFDSDTVMNRQLADGTPIDSTIYDNNSTEPAQVICTNTMSLTTDEGREYFIATSGINEGRFNCLSMCLSWTKVISGYTYHQDIRPATRVNFSNKYFNDLGASWDIIYAIYF